MVRIAELLIVRGEYAEATVWLEDASRTNAESVEAAYLAGFLRWLDGDMGGARDHYARALAATGPRQIPHGVPGEGDVRPGMARVAPSDGSLFGSLIGSLEKNGAVDSDAGPHLDRIYEPVRERVRDLAQKTSP